MNIDRAQLQALGRVDADRVTRPKLHGLDLQGSVTIPGEPAPASRPRVVRRGRSYAALKTPRHEQWETRAVAYLRAWWGGRDPLVGPVAIDMVAVFARPANRTPRDCGGSLGLTGQRELAVTLGHDDIWGRIFAFSAKEDVDNVLKLAMDALQKAGVVRNDAQVVQAIPAKVWTACNGDNPGVELRVYGRSA